MATKRKYIPILTLLFALVTAIAFIWFYKSQDPSHLAFKKYIKWSIFPPQNLLEEKYLDKTSQVQDIFLYENGIQVDNKNFEPHNDYKRVYKFPDKLRLVDYSRGFQADFATNYNFDFSYSASYTRAYSENMEVIITREWSPYDDVTEYIEHYLNRFILDERYRLKNEITLTEDTTRMIGKNSARVIRVTLDNLDPPSYDSYTYVMLKTGTRNFYRFMFKNRSDNAPPHAEFEEIIENFNWIKRYGEMKGNLNFAPREPDLWTDETKNLYHDIKNSTTLQWGIFATDIYGEGIEETVPRLEQSLDYTFPVVLSYIHFRTPFPAEFMQKAYEDGRIVELTYQVTNYNNEDLFGHTPMLDIYRGRNDEEIRAFARGAKEFGHPFLFRLNNEMNSDWTSYSGIINLSDPQIYIDVWRRFYDIFQEEGVGNAIWVFNPNDRNYPPCDWNHCTNYYPGNDYVQMLGITGYNTGTYYGERFDERWREFNEIYREIEHIYTPFFKEFPWIITEFASSSIGGDKAGWINRMFRALPNFPQIKIAVWFSAADYDNRPIFEGVVSRPYWLDETPETLAAFRRGVHRTTQKYKKAYK